MTIRTVKLSSYQEYLTYIHGPSQINSDVDSENSDRSTLLNLFPFSSMLLISFPEMDFANRWCWKNFGPSHGECLQSYSEYPVCTVPKGHRHDGSWCTHWFDKIDYDYGYNEWYFSSFEKLKLFESFIPDINWGECYPK